MLIPPFKHGESSGLEGAAFNADETKILTWGRDGAMKQWDIAIDTGWPADKTVLGTEVLTGTTLGPTGESRVLSAASWQNKKWCEYDEIQHRLGRITDEQWRTSQRLCRELRDRSKATSPGG